LATGASLAHTPVVALVAEDHSLGARLPLLFYILSDLVLDVLVDVLTESLLVESVIEPRLLIVPPIPRPLVFFRRVLILRDPRLHLICELMPEISNLLVVRLLYILRSLKLKASMHRLVILSHLLLEMRLKVLGILFENRLAVNWVLLKIAVVWPRFWREVELALAIMNRIGVVCVSWQVWGVASEALLNSRRDG
jgi:hypothetical protein